MRKLFYLCFVVIALFATGCKDDDVSPVKRIHLELSHDNISINGGGGSASVTVYCNDSWEVHGSCDWCSPSLRSGMANDEDGTVVNFDAKESYAPREAIFYFMCGEICLELKVIQEQKNVIFADEQNIFNIPASGGVALIEYKTNVLCEVIIPTEAEDWISLTSTRALRDESMGLYIAPNETYDSRSATIMIVAIGDDTLCAWYTINQAQKDVILAGEDNKFIVSSDGGDVNIDFETNVNYKVNIPSNARDWITLVEPTRGVSPHNIVLRVAMNKTYDKRSAVISITKSGASNPTVEYTIEQMQNDDIVFEGDVLLTPAKGGSVVLDYQANVDCEVIIPDDAKEWISIDPQTRGLEKYSVTLVIAPNDSFDERTATIKVEGETVSRDIEVKQMGIERVLSLTPSTLDLPLDATTVTVDVEANIDYEVIIAEDCDWITIPESESASENKVIFAITENSTIYSRDTEILFKGDGKDVVLPVIQRGDEGIIILNEEYIVDGQETVLSIEFGSNFDYTVSIPDTCDWLSLPETRAVIQTHTIEFALTKNPSIDDRSVEVIFSDAEGDISKSVKITQLGSPINCVVPNDNEVLYITTDGEVLDISDINLGYTTVIDHTYEDGIGRIMCSSDITLIDGFDGCTTLEQIAIPDSVTTIGERAFYYCDSLISVTIPDSVTTIGEYAFYSCDSLTSVTIGDSVTTIGERAFYYCDSLISVTIPDSVTTIGESAFSYCSNLTSVTIPDSVTTIGNSAFQGCSSLTSVTIGDSVTEIGYRAFRNCTSLTSVTVPDSVTTIGGSAFYNCDSLTSVAIGDSVTSIGDYAFWVCSSLTSVTISDIAAWCNISFGNRYSNPLHYAHNLYLNNELVTDVVIPDSVTEIGDYAFYYCDSLTSVTIPDSVTSIGEEAFEGCFSLTSITIPDSVTSIGESAFSGCSNLTSVYISDIAAWCNISFSTWTSNPLFYARNLYLNNELVTDVVIPDSVTEIGNYTFDSCSSLTSVTIHDSVTTIGEMAFYGCSSLTSVTIPNSVTEIGERAFEDCYGLTSVTIGDNVTSIGERAFYNCNSLTSINIPESVTSIGEKVFYNCTGELIVNCNIPNASSSEYGTFYGSKFTKVTIGNGVTSIGDYAFYGCTSLKSINIPESVTSIGNEVFYGCTGQLIINNKIVEKDYNSSNYPFKTGWLYGSKFTSLIIGNGVTTIGDYAFYGCTSLKSINIPESVTSIGNEVFYGCTGQLIINNKIVEKDYNSSNYPFKTGWLYGSKFTSLIIGNGVTSIGDYVFYGCSSLTNVTIGDSVTSIGSYAFRWCSSLTSVTIPDSVTTIGDYAFNNCSLTSITIPDSVTEIGEGAFSGCSSLTSVTIPDSVTSIGESAFSGCSSLKSITIGDGVTSIGSYAFEYCTSLTRVTIPDSVTSIGYHAFYYCSSLTSVYCKATTPPAGGYDMFYLNASGRKIYVPMESVKAYKSASYWSDYKSYIVGYNF